MKYRYVAGVVALSLCLGAAVAQAQYYYNSPPPAGPYPPPPAGPYPPPPAVLYLPPDAGPYFHLGVGPSFFEDGQLTEFGGPVSSTVNYQTGLAADATFGWAFNQYVAADFETGFIGANINNVSGFSSDNSSIYNVPFLVNVTLSLPIPRTILVPYIGAGVGGADVVFETDSFRQNSSGNTVYGSESDVVFAGQIFAGLRFRLSPNMSFDVGCKYFTTGDPSFSYPPAPNFPVGFQGVRTHSILFDFVWKF
jgi:opacity protein-like surface antigen